MFESYAELSEPIRIPSSVITFAVIRSLVLMRLQNCSINWGKVVALMKVHFRSPVWMFMASRTLRESRWFRGQ